MLSTDLSISALVAAIIQGGSATSLPSGA